MLSNKIYDVLKFAAQIVLPAAATLYFGLASIWKLPYSEQIVGTILAVDAFLGALLGLSKIQYNKTLTTPQPGVSETVPSEATKNIFSMSNSTYDILYWIAQIALPALGALYFALSSIWTLPYGEEIVGTISLLDAFLGILLGISTFQYRKLTTSN